GFSAASSALLALAARMSWARWKRLMLRGYRRTRGNTIHRPARHPGLAVKRILRTSAPPASLGSIVKYEIVAEAYRDLEVAGGRLALIDRLAALLERTPAELLPTVCYLCQGLIAPEFAGVDLGLAEKMAVRAVATATGTGPEQVAAALREIGDL